MDKNLMTRARETEEAGSKERGGRNQDGETVWRWISKGRG